jgi:hypothetical protein
VILAEAVNPGMAWATWLNSRARIAASWSFAGLLVIGGIGLLTDFLICLMSACSSVGEKRRKRTS